MIDTERPAKDPIRPVLLSIDIAFPDVSLSRMTGGAAKLERSFVNDYFHLDVCFNVNIRMYV